MRLSRRVTRAVPRLLRLTVLFGLSLSTLAVPKDVQAGRIIAFGSGLPGGGFLPAMSTDGTVGTVWAAEGAAYHLYRFDLSRSDQIEVLSDLGSEAEGPNTQLLPWGLDSAPSVRISEDGETIVCAVRNNSGYLVGSSIYRSSTGEWDDLSDSYWNLHATGLSWDGQTVSGTVVSKNPMALTCCFMGGTWNERLGFRKQGNAAIEMFHPASGDCFATSTGASADGTVLIGGSSGPPDWAPGYCGVSDSDPHSLAWTSAGAEVLPFPALAISGNGNVVACYDPYTLGFPLWTRSTQTLETIAMPASARPSCINWRGDVASGTLDYSHPDFPFGTFVWTRTDGVMTPQVYLQSLGADLNGWVIQKVEAMSASGKSVMGSGTYHGQQTLWYFSPDDDGDGILDEWETAGGGIPKSDGTLYDLAALGATPKRKDIFVEIDAMAGRAPGQAVLDALIQAFDLATVDAPEGVPEGLPGVGLHLFVDKTDLTLRDYNSGMADFDVDKSQNFGFTNPALPAERNNTASWLRIERAKRKVFRYCIFADRLPNGVLGKGELGGNDLVLALGPRPIPGGTNNEKAGCFMHELGHTLGLTDGGGVDRVLMKPNYYSVMNYLWNYPRDWCPDGAWKLRYSDEAYPTLCESDLNESVPLAGDDPDVWVLYSVPWVRPPGGRPCNAVPLSREKPGSSPDSRAKGSMTTSAECFEPMAGVRWARFGSTVDWDEDGVPSEVGVSSDINAVGCLPVAHAAGQELPGHDDWSNLQYNFRNSSDYEDLIHVSVPVELTAEQWGSLDELAPPSCPTITRASPDFQSICSPATTTLQAGSDGTDLTFQWYAYPFTEPLPGETDSTLALDAISTDAYRRCIVSNACGKDTMDFYVQVPQNPPAILVQPQSMTVDVGDSVYIDPVMVEPMAYSGVWRKNGVVLPEWDGASGIYFEPVTFANAGTYEGTITNGCGSVVTQPMTLLVSPIVTGVEPDASAFYLRPQNPAKNDISAWIGLPMNAPATLSIYNVAGRKLLSRDIGELGPGSHRVKLGEGVIFAPGYYVLRLVQAGKTLTGRVLLVR